MNNKLTCVCTTIDLAREYNAVVIATVPMSDINGKSLKYVCAYAVVRILLHNTLYKCIVQSYDAIFTDTTERVEYT